MGALSANLMRPNPVKDADLAPQKHAERSV